jgi:alpha-glucosidase (family GH31 glycosyl hydrolase)
MTKNEDSFILPEIFVEVLDANILHIKHLRNDQKEPFENSKWYADVVLIQPSSLTSNYDIVGNGTTYSIRDRNGKTRFQVVKAAYESNGCCLEIKKSKDELLYGWGERFDRFYRSTGKIHFESKESPEFIQKHSTYSAIPYYLSNKLYGLLFLNSYEGSCVIKDDSIKIKTQGGNLDYIIILGDSPKEIVEKYIKLTGSPKLVPRWAFGLWATCYPQENQFRVLQYIRDHREKQISLDVLVFDYHWEDRFHNFKWRSKLFPDPERMILELRKSGVKSGLIFTPFINYSNQPVKKAILNRVLNDVSKGCENDVEQAREDYKIVKSEGYFAHDRAEWWFGKGGMLDFTHPDGCLWWNEKLLPLYQSGISFFKNDDGEYLPHDAHSQLGISGKEYHNLYGFYYGKAIYEGMEKLDNRRGLIYSRSVWAGSQRYPAMFLGDQHPDFDNIRKTIIAGLNMSLSGFAYWTADTFGLDGKTNPETHMRYAQWALFSPIARYFYRPEYIDATRYPWSHQKEVIDNFRSLVNLRYKLLPTYYSLAWEAFKKGIPILRPVFFEFPEDKPTWEIDDQIMLGNGIMITPVTKRGAKNRNVYFPRGLWFDFWNGLVIDGGKRQLVDAPLNKIPIFVKMACIFAMGPEKAYIADDHKFDYLDIHIWGRGNNTFEIYDDDGLTRNYINGEYLITTIYTIDSSTGYEIKIIPQKNTYWPGFDVRKLKFHLHGVTQPLAVLIDKKPVSFYFDQKNKLINFPLDSKIDEQYVIDVLF